MSLVTKVVETRGEGSVFSQEGRGNTKRRLCLTWRVAAVWVGGGIPNPLAKVHHQRGAEVVGEVPEAGMRNARAMEGEDTKEGSEDEGRNANAMESEDKENGSGIAGRNANALVGLVGGYTRKRQ